MSPSHDVRKSSLLRAVVFIAAMVSASNSLAVGSSASGPRQPSHAKSFFSAGYLRTGVINEAVAAFTVPKLDCADQEQGVGFGLIDSRVPGAASYLALVLAHCKGGKSSYLLGVYSGGIYHEDPTVNAGDKIVAQIVGDGTFATASVRNKSKKITISDSGQASSDELLYGAVTTFFVDGQTPDRVPDFGELPMTGEIGAGSPIGSDFTKVQWVSNNKTRIHTGKLDDGKFTLKFKRH